MNYLKSVGLFLVLSVLLLSIKFQSREPGSVKTSGHEIQIVKYNIRYRRNLFRKGSLAAEIRYLVPFF